MIGRSIQPGSAPSSGTRPWRWLDRCSLGDPKRLTASTSSYCPVATGGGSLLALRRAPQQPPVRAGGSRGGRSSWLGASTITLTTGSVPEARTRTRPSSPELALRGAATASLTPGPLRSTSLERTRHVDRVPGGTRPGHLASQVCRAGIAPVAFTTSRSRTAVRSPSPVRSRGRAG